MKKHNFSFEALWKKSKQWHWILFIMLLSSALLLWQQQLENYKTSVLPSKTPAPFDGTVSPLPQIPKWTSLTSAEYKATFSSIPSNKLMPLPTYDVDVLKTPLAQLGWKTEKDLAIRNAKTTYTTLYGGDYNNGETGSHPALDIKALKGTPVSAIANGIVVKATEESAGFGKHVVIKHPDAPSYDNPNKTEVIYSGYAHLDQILVSEGDVVKKGQIIGKSGDSGLATGPHLHFQIDRADAPFHLYWPFTSKEASDAGLSFFDAVNSGLGRSNALKYTFSPMLYVQKYEKEASHVDTPADTSQNGTSQNTDNSSNSTPDELPPANEANIPPSNETTPDNTTDTSEPTNNTDTVSTLPAVRFEVEHPETFVRNNTITFTIKAVDKNGAVVTNYQPADGIYLQVVAGGAQIPTYLNKADIVKGVISFEAVPTSKVGLQIKATDGKIEGKSNILQSASVSTGVPSAENTVQTSDSNVTSANTDNQLIFTDVLASSSHFTAISFLKTNNVINGYGDGTFRPTVKVRRDEALKFIFNGTNANLVSVTSLPFKDVSLREWNAAYIATAYQRGIVNGFEDKTFKPGETVTRAQFLKMLFKAMKIDVPTKVKTAPFSDIAVNSWEAPYVAYAKTTNLIDGSQKTFQPNKAMTREEIAEVMYRTILLKINKASAYSSQLSASSADLKKYFE